MDQTSQVIGRPYTEFKKDSYIIREFSDKTSTFELVWHRDREDRVVEVIESNNWKFQFDNDFPQLMEGKTFFIPKNTFHRVIKGTGTLKVKIYEAK